MLLFAEETLQSSCVQIIPGLICLVEDASSKALSTGPVSLVALFFGMIGEYTIEDMEATR